MELKDWISSSVSALAILVSIGVFIMQIDLQRRQRKADQKREEYQRKADQEREEHLRQVERIYQPHIQFSIDCKFYGPESDYYLAEFLLSAYNKGLVEHRFKSIRLRVRGIQNNQPFSEWGEKEKEKGKRLFFPESLLNNEEVIPHERVRYFFVEPEVEQVITYVTRIPSPIKYILVHVLFEYDDNSDYGKNAPHTAERVFQIKQG